MKFLIKLLALLLALGVSIPTRAAVNIEIYSPGVVMLNQSMQTRYSQLAGHYNGGIVGLTADGFVAVRDNNAVPLAERQALNAIVSAENQDRTALYIEIAKANGHPELVDEVRMMFAQRWIQRAQGGWWIYGAKGWFRK